MKHLPNLLTLANLCCGCIAIAFILNAQPYRADFNGEAYWVLGPEQVYMGSIFIAIAAIFDVLDGWAARWLQVFSPIGKDLDSLADVVSFGVAPSMILFKMLWGAYMRTPDAMDTPMLAMAPAFVFACFGALRLATFNNTASDQKTAFKGMPIPAAGLFVATFPLINYYNPYQLGNYLQGSVTIYIIIAVLCWLMVSNIRFFKLIPPSFKLNYVWPQLLLVVVGGIGVAVIKLAALPLVFVLYILLSLIYKQPEPAVANH